jgi:hypothetical protein
MPTDCVWNMFYAPKETLHFVHFHVNLSWPVNTDGTIDEEVRIISCVGMTQARKRLIITSIVRHEHFSAAVVLRRPFVKFFLNGCRR